MSVADPLPVGASAPDFALRNQHGQDVSVASLRGSSTLLVFYPYAFSRVCGGELETLNAELDRLRPAKVVGISVDPLFSVRAYHESLDLGFDLLSDFWPHGQVAQDFGVFDTERGVSRRSTFLLDADAVVRWSVHNPEAVAREVQDYVAAIGALTGTDLP